MHLIHGRHGYSFGRCLLSFFAVFIVFVTFARQAAAQPAYVAGTWNDNSVHLLDSNLNNISSFPTGSGNPNGMATDGVLIYSGHFTTNEVIAYNFSGVEQFRWSGSFSNLQGMDLVGSSIAIHSNDIFFFDALTGTPQGSIPGQSSIEGLAYDGTYLWQLNDSVIYASNPADGSVIYTIPNPAVNNDFSGTGLTASGPGQLTVGATNGDWWKISSVDGSIMSFGNNGLDMYGLKWVPAIPEPTSLAIASIALIAGCVIRRRT